MMKTGIFFYLGFFLSLSILSCKQKEENIKIDNRKETLLIFKEATEKLKKNPDLEARLAFWHKQLSNAKFSSDSVLTSKIHYNIAGVFYAHKNLDSIKSHMQSAWAFMENQKGYDEDKVQLYSGLGNVAHMEQKLHQENYYYNQAGQRLLADSSLKLTPKQKITIYFAAAQSSGQLRQFDNAFIMNRKAIELLPKLPENHTEKFRAYSQMAACYYSSDRSLDSLYSYIIKMQNLYKTHPEDYDVRFVFDRKASYFTKKGEKDSALFYNRKRLSLDILDAKESGDLANSIQTGNLYTSYCDMAGIFTDLKQLDSANYYLKKCEEFAKDYPSKIDEESLILYGQNLIDYKFATKQYDEAERQQDILIQRLKFVYETENSRSIAEMGALFQLQAKDQSIHNLNKSVVLAQTNLQSNRLWLAVSTLASLLAISFVLILYFIQRQRKLKNETEKVQLEQRLLRTQMEPHFIFNTLSALQSFIRFNENGKALKYLHQFGRLLRSSLQQSRESNVKLSEEIETLENYLSLQQMRYDDAFCYKINFDEEQDLESIYIPPMLVQPFVENAILHGINPNGKNGKIILDFDVRTETLVVTITDNGKGISKLSNPQKHKSLSTTISKERLAIIAKESGLPASIVIKSEENKGTAVIISIPMKSA